MKTMTDFWKLLQSRWRNHMPLFFKRLMWLGGLMSGTAIAAHEAMDQFNIQPDAWWIFIERYLIGGGAGIVFACKFTQTYGKNGEPIRNGLEPTAPSAVNNSDVETESVLGDSVAENDIEPYNEHLD